VRTTPSLGQIVVLALVIFLGKMETEVANGKYAGGGESHQHGPDHRSQPSQGHFWNSTREKEKDWKKDPNLTNFLIHYK
jgi:hypothetical protein